MPPDAAVRGAPRGQRAPGGSSGVPPPSAGARVPAGRAPDCPDGCVGSQLSGWDWSLKLGDTWLYFPRKETSLSYVNGEIHNLKTPRLLRQHHHFDFRQQTALQSLGSSDDP